MRILLVLALTAGLWGSAQARPVPPPTPQASSPTPSQPAPVRERMNLTQVRVNLTLACQDMGDSLQRLQALVQSLGGSITNLNQGSGNGNINLRLPPDQVSAFMEKVRGLGDIQNQNMSSSDNTRSYREAQQTLELLERMQAVEWSPRGPVSAADRGAFETELRSFIKERIQSCRSNLANQEEGGRWAEVSINLTGPSPSARHRPREVPREVRPTPRSQDPAEPAAVGGTASGPAPWLLIFPSLFLGVCLSYFLFGRRKG